MSAKEAAKKRAIQSIKLNDKETKTTQHSELDGRNIELLYNELISSENGFYPSKDTEYTPKTSGDFQGQEKAVNLPCRPVSRQIGSSNNVTDKLSPIQNFLSEEEHDKIVDKLRYNFLFNNSIPVPKH